MNSTQLHYREATRHLNNSAHAVGEDIGTAEDLSTLLTAAVHALLSTTAALQELTRQAHPGLEDVAEAVGVYHPTPDNVIRHHAFNAFGNAE